MLTFFKNLRDLYDCADVGIFWNHCIYCTVWGWYVAQARSLHSSVPPSAPRGGRKCTKSTRYVSSLSHNWLCSQRLPLGDLFCFALAHLFFALGRYLCTISCIAVTVSYLKYIVSKRKTTYHRSDPWTHDAHTFQGQSEAMFSNSYCALLIHVSVFTPPITSYTVLSTSTPPFGK